jgi:hypothetical protein
LSDKLDITRRTAVGVIAGTLAVGFKHGGHGGGPSPPPPPPSPTPPVVGSDAMLYGDESSNTLALNDGGNLQLWGDSPGTAAINTLPRSFTAPAPGDEMLVYTNELRRTTLKALRNRAVAHSSTENSSSGRVYANDFYDGVHFKGPIGSSQTLRTKYASLGSATTPGTAKYDYPTATSLDDEVDSLALQNCFDWCYNTFSSFSRKGGLNANASDIVSETVILDGHYVLNKTVNISGGMPIIEGMVCAFNGLVCSGETIVQNIGVGTVDDPIYAFMIVGHQEWLIPGGGNYYLPPAVSPPGTTPNRLAGSLQGQIRNIKFCGNFADMHSANPGISNYASAICILQATWIIVEDCVFCGTLYDGIVFRAQQMFAPVRCNLFINVHRDAIATWSFNNPHADFSTTEWFHLNRFESIGRMAMWMCADGGTQPCAIISDNWIESGVPDSAFVQAPEWFPGGIVAPVVYMNMGGGHDLHNFYHVAAKHPEYWADIGHLGAAQISIRNSNCRAIMGALTSYSGLRTTEAVQYTKPYGRLGTTAHAALDVTNRRNYRLATATDPSYIAPIAGFTLDNLWNFFGVLWVGSQGIYLGDWSNSLYKIGNYTEWVVPTRDNMNSNPLTVDAWQRDLPVWQPRHHGIPSLIQPTAGGQIWYQVDPTGFGVTGSIEPAWPIVSRYLNSLDWPYLGLGGGSGNETTGVAATGFITFNRNPVPGEYILFYGAAVTFVTGPPAAMQVQIGATLTDTLNRLVAFANATSNGSVNQCTYVAAGNTLQITYKVKGSGWIGGSIPGGNGYSLIYGVKDGTATWRTTVPPGMPTSYSTTASKATATVTYNPNRTGYPAKMLRRVRILGADYQYGYGGLGNSGSLMRRSAVGMNVTTWQANTDYSNKFGKNFDVSRMIVLPPTYNGYAYICTTPGRSGSKAPDFASNAALGRTVSDGTVQWTCFEWSVYDSSVDGKPQRLLIDRTIEKSTAIPTTGTHRYGDIAWNTRPTAGGKAAWVCVQNGTPGLWKACYGIGTD